MAVELVEATKNFSGFSYLITISLVVMIGFIIFFIKKLNYNFKHVLKSIIVSLIITLVIEILYFAVGKMFGIFRVMCKIGGHCPSEFDIFLFKSVYVAPLILLLTLLGYYILKNIYNF